MKRFSPSDIDNLFATTAHPHHRMDDVPEGFFQDNELAILRRVSDERAIRRRNHSMWFSAAAVTLLLVATFSVRWVTNQYSVVMQTDELYTVHDDEDGVDINDELDTLEELEESDLFIQYF